MRMLLALSALCLAAGCTHPTDRTRSPAFGVSAEAMRDAQTTSVEASDEAPEGSGAVSAAAQQRYQSGQTRPLQSSSTSVANPSSN
jgi:hypothetical protein